MIELAVIVTMGPEPLKGSAKEPSRAFIESR